MNVIPGTLLLDSVPGLEISVILCRREGQDKNRIDKNRIDPAEAERTSSSSSESASVNVIPGGLLVNIIPGGYCKTGSS